MKTQRISAIVMLAGLALLSSCGGSDSTPKVGVSFESASSDVKESDGTVTSFNPLLWENYSGNTGATGVNYDVSISLDKAAAETSVIKYSISGTATETSASTYGDFAINGDDQYVIINKGDTKATITITVFEDFELEIDNIDDSNDAFETVVLKLESVVSGSAKIGDNNTYTLNIHEDDAVVQLGWVANDQLVADMDLFIWNNSKIINGSASTSNSPYEVATIPAGFGNGTYGLSYTYYSGTSNDVTITSEIFNLGGTLNNQSTPLSFSADYTSENINVYDADGAENPAIVQSMTKNKFNYTGIDDIVVASGTSRVSTNTQTIKSRIDLIKSLKLHSDIMNFNARVKK